MVVVNLGDKEIPLQLLDQLDLLDLPSTAKVSDELLVLGLTKRQALDLVQDKLWSGRQTAHARDLWNLQLLRCVLRARSCNTIDVGRPEVAMEVQFSLAISS